MGKNKNKNPIDCSKLPQHFDYNAAEPELDLPDDRDYWEPIRPPPEKCRKYAFINHRLVLVEGPGAKPGALALAQESSEQDDTAHLPQWEETVWEDQEDFADESHDAMVERLCIKQLPYTSATPVINGNVHKTKVHKSWASQTVKEVKLNVGNPSKLSVPQRSESTNQQPPAAPREPSKLESEKEPKFNFGVPLKSAPQLTFAEMVKRGTKIPNSPVSKVSTAQPDEGLEIAVSGRKVRKAKQHDAQATETAKQLKINFGKPSKSSVRQLTASTGEKPPAAPKQSPKLESLKGPKLDFGVPSQKAPQAAPEEPSKLGCMKGPKFDFGVPFKSAPKPVASTEEDPPAEPDVPSEPAVEDTSDELETEKEATLARGVSLQSAPQPESTEKEPQAAPEEPPQVEEPSEVQQEPAASKSSAAVTNPPTFNVVDYVRSKVPQLLLTKEVEPSMAPPEEPSLAPAEEPGAAPIKECCAAPAEELQGDNGKEAEPESTLTSGQTPILDPKPPAVAVEPVKPQKTTEVRPKVCPAQTPSSQISSTKGRHTAVTVKRLVEKRLWESKVETRVSCKDVRPQTGAGVLHILEKSFNKVWGDKERRNSRLEEEKAAALAEVGLWKTQAESKLSEAQRHLEAMSREMQRRETLQAQASDMILHLQTVFQSECSRRVQAEADLSKQVELAATLRTTVDEAQKVQEEQRSQREQERACLLAEHGQTTSSLKTTIDQIQQQMDDQRSRWSREKSELLRSVEEVKQALEKQLQERQRASDQQQDELAALEQQLNTPQKNKKKKSWFRRIFKFFTRAEE